jgi:[FeFe] hydrogenase H-cluster maturation GTPase HydF
VKKGDIVILVIPVDESAPKGRLILPQQETLREILDEGGIAFACQPGQLEKTLSVLRERPRLVITDSQAFAFVAEKVPREIPLTSFSILFARYKGNLDFLSAGAKKISALRDGDKILIAESCTHHRQCRDIGTVQLPAMVKNFSGKNVQFEFSSGAEFPSDLSEFSLVIHCGGCMITEQQMKARMEAAKNAGVSVVNYGTAMAYMNGIFSRCMEIFGGF